MTFQKGHGKLSNGTTGKHWKVKDTSKMSEAQKGRKHSKEDKRKQAEAKIGRKNPRWKDENVSHSALHHWVRFHKGKPKQCQDCGKKASDSYVIHWSNIDHKYRRVLSDYVEKCVSCHKFYDKKLAIKQINS